MIFYFTGTGNSLYIAKQLDSDCRSIPQLINSATNTYEAERIGIVCPIYGHEMPAMVKEFLKKVQFQTSYLFVILTYGNRHANAVELAQKALAQVGKEADYITTVLMVDNFLLGFDMAEQTQLDKGIEKQLAEVKKAITEKKQEYQKVTTKDRLAHQGYLNLVANKPETIWADFTFTDECIGCGICVKVCPAGCIHLENQRAVRIAIGCQSCYACIHACPKSAIQLNKILGLQDKNPKDRYRNEHITLGELIQANNQTNE